MTIANSGTVNVTAGCHTMASVGIDPALGGPANVVGNLDVTGNGTTLILLGNNATGAASVSQNSLTIGSGATVALGANSAADWSTLNSVSIANWADTTNGPTGRLDVGVAGY